MLSLKESSYELAELYASLQPGEGWHPEYKKDRDAFKKLIATNIKIRRHFTRYFRDLAGRVGQRVNWGEYNARLIKAAEPLITDDWPEEIVTINVDLDQILFDSFSIGALAQEADFGFSSGFMPGDDLAQAALRKYTLRLAGDINETTIKQVKQNLLSSLKQGFNQSQATDRLAKLVDNPYRAGMIAHTETVRAYSEGVLSVGERVGAEYKIWFDGQPGACNVCRPLDRMEVPFDEDFPTLLGPRRSTPAHPWCKCLTKLKLK